LIKVKKNFSKPISKKTVQFCLKYNDLPQNIVFRRRKYRLQLIDTITPLFIFYLEAKNENILERYIGKKILRLFPFFYKN